MTNRNIVRSSSLALIGAVTLFSASTNARSTNQKPGQQTEANSRVVGSFAETRLMATGRGIPDVDVVLRKGKGSISGAAGNARTNKDGWFSFDNLPFGTYNLNFAAPKVSPAIAGKVEYLVVVQQFEIRADLDGKPGNSSAKTYSESKSNTAKRVRIVGGDYGKEGFDFEVGPQPQAGTLKTKPEIIATKPVESESEARKAKESKGGIAPQAMNVRGKIFLVEIGTTKIVLDQPGVKAPSQ